jgi:hypothetical protein
VLRSYLDAAEVVVDDAERAVTLTSGQSMTINQIVADVQQMEEAPDDSLVARHR